MILIFFSARFLNNMKYKLNHSKRFGAFALSTTLALILLPVNKGKGQEKQDLSQNISSNVEAVLKKNPDEIFSDLYLGGISINIQTYQEAKAKTFKIINSRKRGRKKRRKVFKVQEVDLEKFSHLKIFLGQVKRIKKKNLKEKKEGQVSEYEQIKKQAQSLGIKTEEIAFYKSVRNGTRIISERYRQRFRTCKKVKINRKKRKGRRKFRQQCSTSFKWKRRSKSVARYKKVPVYRDSKAFEELLEQRIMNFEGWGREDDSDEKISSEFSDSRNINFIETLQPDLFYLSEIRKKIFPEKGAKALFPEIFLEAIKKSLKKENLALNPENFSKSLKSIKLEYRQKLSDINRDLYDDEVRKMRLHILAAREYFVPKLLGKAIEINMGEKDILKSQETAQYSEKKIQSQVLENSSEYRPLMVTSSEIIKPPEKFQIERSEMLANGGIKLNEHYQSKYNFEAFKIFLPDFAPNLSKDMLEKIFLEVETMRKGLPKGWEFGLIRTLTKKIKKLGHKFSILDLIKNPITLTNTGTNKTAIYNPDLPKDERWTFHISEIGKGGLGNRNNSHATPLGSFLVRAGYVGGRYRDERTRVIGIDHIPTHLEKNLKYYLRHQKSLGAHSVNPDNYDNTNSDYPRLIRYHGVTTTFKKTIGCVRLESKVAQYLRSLTRKYRYGSSEIMAGLPAKKKEKIPPESLLIQASLTE